MIGSVLVNYSELTTTPANPRWEVRVNGILVVNERDLQYTKASRLYSTRVSPGDTLTIGIFGIPVDQVGSIGVYRKDYTTDDEGGDNGIKIINITGRTGNNGSDAEGGFCVLYNIPITTRPDAYGFEYITDLTVGTGLIDIIECSGGSAISGATISVISLPLPNNGDFVKLYLAGSNYFNGTNCYEVTNNNSLGPISTPTSEFTGITVNSSYETCAECSGCLPYTVFNPGPSSRDFAYYNCIGTISSRGLLSGTTISVCATGFELTTGLIITPQTPPCDISQINGITGTTFGSVCPITGSGINFYYQETFTFGTVLYIDAGCTVPVSTMYFNPGDGFVYYIFNGIISSSQSCP